MYIIPTISTRFLLFFGAFLTILPVVRGQNRYMAYRNTAYDGPKTPDLGHLSQKLWAAADFCRDNGLNEDLGIFIDLGMNSGYFRCWVIGFSDGVIRYEGLVSHGSGKGNWLPTGTRQYSNEKGSLLSSLGKYKTGPSFTGQYGHSYRLHGLENSNSNALSRGIVFHAQKDIPDFESTKALFQSSGCPSVSPRYFRILSSIIDQSPEPLLVWIFDSTR